MFYFFYIPFIDSVKKDESSFADGNEGRVVFAVYLIIIC